MIPFPRWQKACDRVSAALLGGEKRVVVVGPPGTGKTLLLDHISRVLRAAGWTVVMRLADAAPLQQQHGNVALLIDEADRLSREALQQLLATVRCPVVLAGLDALQSRVEGATQIVLSPLGREEARDYIASWLGHTGRDPSNLEAAAMRRTVEISGGVPRLTSTLLGAAAWLAESADETVITVQHVEEAAALRSCFVPGDPEHVEFLIEDTPERSNTPILVGLAAAMLLLGAGAYVATRYYPIETENAVGSVRQMAGLNADVEPSAPKRTQVASVAKPATPSPPAHEFAAEAPKPPPVTPAVAQVAVLPPPPAPPTVELAATPQQAEPPKTEQPKTEQPDPVRSAETVTAPPAPTDPTVSHPDTASRAETIVSASEPTRSEPIAEAPIQPPPIQPSPIQASPIQASPIQPPSTEPTQLSSIQPPLQQPAQIVDAQPELPAPPLVATKLASLPSAPLAPPASPVIAPSAPKPAPVAASAKSLAPDRQLPAETISLLMRRGSDMMSIGDISAARLLFVRAAEAGNADAMLEMGRTFDPTVLAQASPLMPPDPVEATRWYRRAVEAGNSAAEALLNRSESSR